MPQDVPGGEVEVVILHAHAPRHARQVVFEAGGHGIGAVGQVDRVDAVVSGAIGIVAGDVKLDDLGEPVAQLNGLQRVMRVPDVEADYLGLVAVEVGDVVFDLDALDDRKPVQAQGGGWICGITDVDHPVPLPIVGNVGVRPDQIDAPGIAEGVQFADDGRRGRIRNVDHLQAGPLVGDVGQAIFYDHVLCETGQMARTDRQWMAAIGERVDAQPARAGCGECIIGFDRDRSAARIDLIHLGRMGRVRGNDDPNAPNAIRDVEIVSGAGHVVGIAGCIDAASEERRRRRRYIDHTQAGVAIGYVGQQRGVEVIGLEQYGFGLAGRVEMADWRQRIAGNEQTCSPPATPSATKTRSPDMSNPCAAPGVSAAANWAGAAGSPMDSRMRPSSPPATMARSLARWTSSASKSAGA